MCSRLVTSFSPLGFESFHSTHIVLTYYVYYCFMHEPASPQRVVQRITSITKQGEGRTQLSFALFSLLPFGKCICNPPAKLMKSYVQLPPIPSGPPFLFMSIVKSFYVDYFCCCIKYPKLIYSFSRYVSWCVLIILGVPYITAHIYCKSSNLSNTDIRNDSIDLR